MTLNILMLGAPSVLSALLEKSMEMINSIFIGRYSDPSKLAAFGLAHSVMNLFCFYPMYGLNSGQETLVS